MNKFSEYLANVVKKNHLEVENPEENVLTLHSVYADVQYTIWTNDFIIRISNNGDIVLEHKVSGWLKSTKEFSTQTAKTWKLALVEEV